MKNDNKTIQKLLNKLISEEIIAYCIYTGCIYAAKKDVSDKFSQLFQKIAIDERDDHAKNLIEYAKLNGYEIVFKFSEYERYASEECFKLLKSLKREEKAKYYIDLAVKAEEDAIRSYEEALKEDVEYSFQQLLYYNLYDEYEHLEDLQTLSYGIDAGVKINVL